MKQLVMLLLALALMAGCQPIQRPAEKDTVEPTAEPTVAPALPFGQEVEMRVHTIESEALAGNVYGDPATRSLFVLVPADYETSGKRYPVVYVLPGGNGDGSMFVDTVKQALKLLLRNGEGREMIVVFPDGQNAFNMSLFRSSAVLGDYESYATQEIVDFIDANYRTLATRESRGIAGCSNGGTAAMNLGLKHPDTYSAIAVTGGIYDEAMEVWPGDVEYIHTLTDLPTEFGDWELYSGENWYMYVAAAAAPNPDNPPFYFEMPIQIVDGKGELVPDVIDRIVKNDAVHAARAYVEQPQRLNGMLILAGLYDEDPALLPPIESFVKVLTELGIEHDYVPVESGHCVQNWEKTILQYMDEKLVFEE